MLFFGTQSSNQLKFSAKKPKDVFEKLEHQKTYFMQEEVVVLGKIMLKTELLSDKQKKRCFECHQVKISVTR